MGRNKSIILIGLTVLLLAVNVMALSCDFTELKDGSGSITYSTSQIEVCLDGSISGYEFTRVKLSNYFSFNKNTWLNISLSEGISSTPYWAIGYGDNIHLVGDDYYAGESNPTTNNLLVSFVGGYADTTYIYCFDEQNIYGAYPLTDYYVRFQGNSLNIYNKTNQVGFCQIPGGWPTSGNNVYDLYLFIPSDGWSPTAGDCLTMNAPFECSVIASTSTTLFPIFNMTSYNNTNYQTTCYANLLNGSVKEAFKCLYIGTNFRRDDGVYTMGYFFYIIVFGGMTFIFYLRHKNLSIAGIVMLIFMSVFHGEFPPEAQVVYWITIVGAITVSLYGLFKND